MRAELSSSFEADIPNDRRAWPQPRRVSSSLVLNFREPQTERFMSRHWHLRGQRRQIDVALVAAIAAVTHNSCAHQVTEGHGPRL